MTTAATQRYLHRLVLEAKDRQAKGMAEPDRLLHAVSAPALDRSCLLVLVNECALGRTSVALYRSTSPGQVVYDPKDIEPECLGSLDFRSRAEALAAEHTRIPAVGRRYPNTEANAVLEEKVK